MSLELLPEYLDLRTRAIHGGLSPDPTTGAILTPIVQSTTYVQEAVGKDKGFTYSRAGNPTVAALERNLGALEGVPLPAVAFSTGLAAETALFLSVLRAGDHVLVSDVVYGGTVRLLRQVLGSFGVESTLVDATDPAALVAGFRGNTKLVFVESPGNPTMKVTDLAAVAATARSRGALFAVDNTLLTPALQRPLDLGADVVVYSTTKFLEGHNATIGGALVTPSPELAEKFRFLQKSVGSIQSPFEAWLTLRGIKTLPFRMDLHAANALAVARFLEGHARVSAVSYPFLESFPQYAVARRQQKAGGGLLAFEVTGGTEAAIRVLNSVKLLSLAENLGAVESLVTHPASMTHASIPREEREAIGISDGLIRVSVGLESPDDVIADLERALRA